MRKILLSTVLCIAISAQAQWSEDQPVRLWGEDVSYPDYMMKASKEGYTWMLSNQIGIANNDEASELYYAQGFDENGNKLLGDEPYLLTDEYYQTYVMVQDNLLVDRDNNALFGVLDHRFDDEGTSVTIYKISPEGEMLWGEDGITIDGDFTSIYVVSLCGIQLEDGSYVFAWTSFNERNAFSEIVVQRVLEDGQLAWDPNSVKMSSPTTMYEYPHLENAGNNQYLMCYACGSTEAIEVMKFDFDGSPVWASPASVYNGSWGSTPLWLKINYAPSGDGGMLITWYADPDFTNLENAYMQYVKPNGKLGFNAKNGLQIDYAEYLRHLGVKGLYDPSSDSFIAVMKCADPNQYQYSVKAQKVSKSGDLLWGEECVEIAQLGSDIFGYASLQLGNEGEVAFFYEKATDAQGRVVSNQATCYNIAKCKEIWKITIGNEQSPKGSYMSANAGNFWVVAWLENSESAEGYSSSEGDIYAMRINFDGTQGSTAGICAPSVVGNNLAYTRNSGCVEFTSNVTVYDVNGRKVADGYRIALNPGLYLAVDNKGNTVKFRL